MILIEGQSSLRNPSGPCGAEFLLSGNCKGVLLQHAPGREYFDGLENLESLIPPIEEEIELITKPIYFGLDWISIVLVLIAFMAVITYYIVRRKK